MMGGDVWALLLLDFYDDAILFDALRGNYVSHRG